MRYNFTVNFKLLHDNHNVKCLGRKDYGGGGIKEGGCCKKSKNIQKPKNKHQWELIQA